MALAARSLLTAGHRTRVGEDRLTELLAVLLSDDGAVAPAVGGDGVAGTAGMEGASA